MMPTSIETRVVERMQEMHKIQVHALQNRIAAQDVQILGLTCDNIELQERVTALETERDRELDAIIDRLCADFTKGFTSEENA